MSDADRWTVSPREMAASMSASSTWLGASRHGLELGARHVLQRGVDFRIIQAFSKDLGMPLS
jgi:hypothetical protein